MTVFHIDETEMKAIIDDMLERLHHVIREAATRNWSVMRVHGPGKVALMFWLHNLPRYAPPGEEPPPLYERINRHIEQLTIETQTSILSYEVDIELGTLGLYVQMNANLVSTAIEQAEVYDRRRQEQADE